MKQTVFTGSATALVTPMREDFSIDFAVFEALMNDQIARGSDALVIAGTTGESATLSDEEHIELIRFAVKAAKGRVPIIAGAGSNNTAHAVALSRAAEKAGADALLHVTPYYNKATQRGLIAHFTACAAATDLPVILYNVPSRTGVNIRIETYEKLAQVSNIVATKEASGNFSQIAKIAAVCGDDLAIYSGNDDQITSALALGAKGVISVLANVAPEDTHQICQAFFDGDMALSDALQLKYLELIERLFSDVNPIPVKQALCFMGIPVGKCRLPLCEMEDIAAEQLLATLHKYGLCSPEETGRAGSVTVRRPQAALLWNASIHG